MRTTFLFNGKRVVMRDAEYIDTLGMRTIRGTVVSDEQDPTRNGQFLAYPTVLCTEFEES